MARVIPVEPESARRAAVHVVAVLRDAGHTAYLAGGCVRDELLGLHPTDFDVATDARPEEIRAIFPRTAEVGVAFGVVLVHIGSPPLSPGSPRVSVEVATFRSDGPYTDKRRPDRVHFSDARADAQRRDFTINALFLDPLDTAESPIGRVIDFVDGQEDLKRRIVRAVGDPHQRLAEDHLRALRAVRFAARLGCALDAATAEAIRVHARELSGVSRERIGDELRRMTAHRARGAALALLQELGLDGPVLNESGVRSELRRVSALPVEGAVPHAAVLAAWALDRGGGAASPEVVGRYRGALCLSNEETTGFSGVLGTVRLIKADWGRLGVAGQKRLAASAWFEWGVAVLAGEDAQQAAAVRARVAELAASASGLNPEPLVTGDDLIAHGMKPGKRFKSLLDVLYDEQLEGRLTKKEAALARAWELAAQAGV